jgi:hypothetical protein
VPELAPPLRYVVVLDRGQRARELLAAPTLVSVEDWTSTGDSGCTGAAGRSTAALSPALVTEVAPVEFAVRVVSVFPDAADADGC